MFFVLSSRSERAIIITEEFICWTLFASQHKLIFVFKRNRSNYKPSCPSREFLWNEHVGNTMAKKKKAAKKKTAAKKKKKR